MNPNESTGQQQPEGDTQLTPEDIEWINETNEYDRGDYSDCCKGRGFRIGASLAIIRERSLSRWREIAVDGLPGDEYKTKWIEFVDITGKFYDSSLEARMILWRQDMGEVFLRAEFTHWRPIDLPTP